MGEKPPAERKVSPDDKPSAPNVLASTDASPEQLSTDTSSKLSAKRSGKRAARKGSSYRTTKPHDGLRYRSKDTRHQDKLTQDKEDDLSYTPVHGKPPTNKTHLAKPFSAGLSEKQLTQSCPSTKDIDAKNITAIDLPTKCPRNNLSEEDRPEKDFLREAIPVKEFSTKDVPEKENNLPAKDLPPGVHAVEELPEKDLAGEETPAVDFPLNCPLVGKFSENNLLAVAHPVERLPATDLHEENFPPVDLPAKDLREKKPTAKDFHPEVLPLKELPAKDVPAQCLRAIDFPVEDLTLLKGHEGNELPPDQEPVKKSQPEHLPWKGFADEDLPVRDPTKDAFPKETEAENCLMVVRFWEDLPHGACDRSPEGSPGATVKRPDSPMKEIVTPRTASAKPAIGSSSCDSPTVGHSDTDSPEIPLYGQKSNLVLHVLKARKLPLDSSQLPLSPMVERQPPPMNRCVSIALRPTIEHLISPPTAYDSDAATLSPETHHHHLSRNATAVARSVSGVPTASRRSFEDESSEKRVMVYPPALKVRHPSLADQQRALTELLSARHAESGSPSPDANGQPNAAERPDQRTSRRRRWIRRSIPSTNHPAMLPTLKGRRGSQASQGDLQHRATTGDLFTVPGGDSGYMSVAVLALVALAVVVAALCVFVAQKLFRRPYVAESDVCDTRDCVEHARHILSTRDQSANPCFSFHAYVCGGGGDVTPTRARGARTGRLRGIGLHQRLARDYAREIVPQSIPTNTTSSAASKALGALAHCLNRSDGKRSATLATFMRERGLTWPASRQVKLVDVLDVLLDLSINWKVSLWFDVRLRYLESRRDIGNAAIVFGEPGHVALLRMEQIAALDQSAYASAVRAIARILAGDSGSNIAEKTFKGSSAIELLRRDETALRKAILSALGDDEMDDAFLTLKESSSVLRNVSSEVWTALLHKYLGPKASGLNISLDTAVLVLCKPLFDRLSALVSTIPVGRLLDVLGWTFAYSYAWIGNPLLDDLPPIDVTGSEVNELVGPFTHVLCFAAVLESFGIAPATPFFVQTFPARERDKVAAVRNATAFTLVAAIETSRGVSNVTKANASAKILSHTFQALWPAQPFQSLDALDSLYARFPSADAKDFYTSWLESRKAQRAALSERSYGTLMTAKLRWYAEKVLYVYSLNYIALGLAAVLAPSYHRQGSVVMTYASLGFQLARKLISTIDQRGRLLDHKGNRTGKAWWERKPKCRLDRARTPKERRAIADLLALDLALATMKNVSATDPSPLRLKLLEKQTPEQTFYVSYCNRFCGAHNARDMCDLTMNGSEFKAAFDCPWRVVDRGCLLF